MIVDDTISKINSQKDTLGEAVMGSGFITTTGFCCVYPTPELINVIREQDKITFIYKENSWFNYGTTASNTFSGFTPVDPKIFKIVVTPAIKIDGTQAIPYFKEERIEGKYIPAYKTEESYEFPE